MTLTTHAAAATAIGFFLPGPWWLGWSLSFASHFVLDTIPHYDYDEKNDQSGFFILKIHDKFKVNLLKVGLDVIGSYVIPIFLCYSLGLPYFYILGCATLAIVPDFLQLVYGLTKLSVLKKLQLFHEWVHSRRRVNNYWWGWLQQGSIVTFIVILLLYLG